MYSPLIWTASYERVVRIVLVLNAKTKLSFSRLHHQLYIIRGLALGTNFENNEVAFCWPIFQQYIGMRLLLAHTVSASKIWSFLKCMNVNITSKFGNCDSKIYLLRVKHGIKQHLWMLQINFEIRTNKKKLTGFYCRSVYTSRNIHYQLISWMFY